MSFKSKMFNFLIRNQHLFRGKLRKDTFDVNTSIADFRARCEKGASKYATLPSGICCKEQIIEGIKSEWLVPEKSEPAKIILYVHGGGYVSGSCNDHRGFVAKFAKNLGVSTLIYEYRLGSY